MAFKIRSVLKTGLWFHCVCACRWLLFNFAICDAINAWIINSWEQIISDSNGRNDNKKCMIGICMWKVFYGCGWYYCRRVIMKSKNVQAQAMRFYCRWLRNKSLYSSWNRFYALTRTHTSPLSLSASIEKLLATLMLDAYLILAFYPCSRIRQQ